jgi:RNA 2',3'-cyclic 3'-phosphodiesterase
MSDYLTKIELRLVIRAFIAINVDPPILREISEAIVQWRRTIPEVRWVAPDKIHLTIKFLGDIEPSRVDPIARALEQALKLFPRFTINAKGLGVFPAVRRPRVLWVGLEGSQLVKLAATVEAALEPLGFLPEARAFQPHLTIGRWRQFEGHAKNLLDELERWKSHDYGASKVDAVTLFQSVLKPDGALHQPLRVIAIAQE